MAEPASILLTVGKVVGPRVGKEVVKWAQGSEAKQLTKLLSPKFPRARGLLLQPAALAELWLYAETGKFDAEAMRAAVRPVVGSDAEARQLTAAIRDAQWRVMRDERRTHFEFLRLRNEIKSDVEDSPILGRIEARLDELRGELPRARQLPAQTSPFVDRTRELEAAEEAFTSKSAVHGALVICCCGMPGAGKSALALELAHRHSGEFKGGWLYIDMRTPAGEARTAEDAAARLLVNLGVAAETIPQDPDARLAALRAALAEESVLLLLDNANDEMQIRNLIPARSDSVVIITSQASLAGIATAYAIDLPEMAEADARLMLETLIGERVHGEPEAANELISRAGGLPLALAVASGRARRRPSEPISELVRTMSMTSDAIKAIDDRLNTLGGTLSAGIAGLSPPARRLFVLICGLGVPEPIPESAAAIGGIDLAKAAALLEELSDQRVLMPRAGGGWRVHQLLRSLGARIAQDEYPEDLASAQARRVAWLAREARALSDELEGGV